MVRLVGPAFPFWVTEVLLNTSQCMYSGSRVKTDPMVQHLLSAGVITPIDGH